jgi:pimeloyl-ACP methyl ester carboxylesterase
MSASDPRSRWLEAKVKAAKTLSLPAIIVQGEADGVSPVDSLDKIHEKFSGPFELVTLPGVGHFPQREAPDALAAHLLSFLA